MWNMTAGKYSIIAVHPNPYDWPTLNVVTRAYLDITKDAKTFRRHGYTWPIHGPLFATIGDGGEHYAGMRAKRSGAGE